MSKKSHSPSIMVLGTWIALVVLLCTPAAAGKRGPNGGWDPLYSPDGSRVAFVSGSMHMPGTLWIMSADGSNARQLSPFGAEGVSWSHDGKSLFFSRWGERTANLWEIKAGEGEEPKKVAAVPESSLDFSFSPGRTLVAYLLPSGPDRDLWVRKTHGNVEMQFTQKFFVRSLTWSPDGKQILFLEGKTYGKGIWSVNLEEGSLKNLASGFSGDPVYSTGGDRVAYAFPWKKIKEGQGRYGIRVMQPDGSGVKEYDARHLTGLEVRWNPDGSGLCYRGSTNIRQGEGESHKMTHVGTETPQAEEEAVLWQIDLKDGREHRLSPRGFTVGSFSWSPDGKVLIMAGASEEGFGSEIWRLDMTTGDFQPLVRSTYADWLSVPSADTTKVAYLSNRNRAGMLVITDDAGGEIRRFDPFPIEENDRITFLSTGNLLFLTNPQGFRVVDLGEQTRLHLQLDPKARILELQSSLRGQKVMINGMKTFDGLPHLSLLAGEAEIMQEMDLGGKGVELQPRWSFDGERIAFTDGTDLWTMGPDGKNRKMLTHYREANESPGLIQEWIARIKGGSARSHVSDPFWSPDGKRIGYILTVYDSEENPGREIRWITPDGSSSKRVYSERIPVPAQSLVSDRTSPPFFDIDGKLIVFTSLAGGLPNLRSVTLSDQTVRLLTETGALFPALLPEKEEILYTSLEGNEERLMVMELDGSGKRPFLAEPPEVKGVVEQK